MPVTRVSRGDATDVVTSLTGTTFFWRGHLVNSALLGDYNVDNALIAMAIMSVLGADDASIAAAMGEVRVGCRPIRRRSRADVTVIVDYAHTPEGLRRLLEDVRVMVPGGRVITVFGCGGDRDRAKRPEMGLVASTYSDLTIVTSDNPRSESPESIIDAVMSGVVSGANVDARRRPAQRDRAGPRGGRRRATSSSWPARDTRRPRPSATLVVPFDDRVVARELLGVPC